MLRYPARATIKAFGGLTAMNRALGTPITTISNWKPADGEPERYIPRWWTEAITKAAREAGILDKLPRPVDPTRKRARAA